MQNSTTTPSPEQIKQSRLLAGLTQTEAAELIYKQCRAWQQYEAGDRKMDPAFYELFIIKTRAKKYRCVQKLQCDCTTYCGDDGKHNDWLTEPKTEPPD